MSDILETLDKLGAETEDALERFMDDKEMYLRYVREFPEEESMKKLTVAVDSKDYDTAEKEVHALKGILNNLGFLPVADPAMDMLAELRDGNVEDALEAYEELTEQYKIYVDAINEWKE